MASRTVAQKRCDLGVEETHTRLYVSYDNPYSEAQFKTLKYLPDFPDRLTPRYGVSWARRHSATASAGTSFG